MSPARTAALSVLATLCAVASVPAHAVIQNIYAAGTASNTCQPALPAFEGTMRKRPLSVHNEGTTTAFVTCALFTAANVATRAHLYVNSTDGQDHIVNCTVVLGYNGNARYVTKQITAYASGGQSFIEVSPADLGAGATSLATPYVSFSCQLPPGTGINDLGVGWQQSIGD